MDEHCWHDMTASGEGAPETQACCLDGSWQRRDAAGQWQPYRPSIHEQDAFRGYMRDVGDYDEDEQHW